VHRRILPLLSLLAFVLVFEACSGVDEKAAVLVDDSLPTPTSTTEAEPADTSTTVASTPPSTVYAPDTLEGQVEAAYLAAWDAYEHALAVPDAELLGGSFIGRALQLTTLDINDLLASGSAVDVDVEHSYTITSITDTRAAVQDIYENHMRLIDPSSGSYLEADPNKEVGVLYTMDLVDDSWHISGINSLASSP
jgi:hypothetical protein